ncbi:MAG: hypothetical protein ACKKMS_02550 [Candidatus Nealsonbacteria bacterium]
MAKERLSKLQKWIIRNCNRCKFSGGEATAMSRKDILGFFAFDYEANEEYEERKNRAEATISRSIKNLRCKGFIEEFSRAIKRGFYMKKENGISIMEEQIKETGCLDKKEGREEIKQSFGNSRLPEYTKLIELTDKGIKKRKELLKLSSDNS